MGSWSQRNDPRQGPAMQYTRSVNPGASERGRAQSIRGRRRQTDRQAGRQTDRHTQNRQTGRQTDTPTIKHPHPHTCEEGSDGEEVDQ
eukprot:507641-Rhodomonas_salina.2